MEALSVQQRKQHFIATWINNPGDTIKSVAQKAGITEQTAFKYLRDPSVKEELARHQKAMMEPVYENIQDGYAELHRLALNRSLDIVKEPKTPSHVVVQILKNVSDFMIRVQEAQQLREELNAVYEQLDRLAIKI